MYDTRDHGCLPFTTNSRKSRFRIFVQKEQYVSFTICPQISGLSRRARLDSYLLLLLKWLRSERPETSTKLEELVNGKQISIRNSSGVPTRKTGLPFQNFRLSREFSSRTNRKNVYHLHPNRNFQEFVVNGEQPMFGQMSMHFACRIIFTVIVMPVIDFCYTVEALLTDTLVSGQLYLRPPCLKPRFNSHTNSVFLHSRKRTFP